MKIHFVPVRYAKKVVLPDDLVRALPDTLVLFTTIQYLDQLDDWQRALTAAGKRVELFTTRHGIAPGHLLGCGIESWKSDAAAFLYVGDGLFHPKALVVKNEKPVFCYDPERGSWSLLKDEDIEAAKRQQRAALAVFLASKEIGVLVTTKQGQQRLGLAFKLREAYPEKHFSFFLCDTLNIESLEDFPFVECFINTMCPRLLDDAPKSRKPILNIGELGYEW